MIPGKQAWVMSRSTVAAAMVALWGAVGPGAEQGGSPFYDGSSRCEEASPCSHTRWASPENERGWLLTNLQKRTGAAHMSRGSALTAGSRRGAGRLYSPPSGSASAPASRGAGPHLPLFPFVCVFPFVVLFGNAVVGVGIVAVSPQYCRKMGRLGTL